MSTDYTTLAKIVLKGSKIFGIRGDDRDDLTIGMPLPESQDMRDDAYDYETGTYPLLNGTSAIDVNPKAGDTLDEDGGIEAVVEYIKSAVELLQRKYLYEHISLIAGSSYEYGDDAEEIIITDAEVVMIIK